jgi:hypothetical protein
MKWVIGLAFLTGFGFVLRRLMRLDGDPASLYRELSPLAPLSPGRESLYRPVALEIDTHATILAISLNEAFEERDSGNTDVAWRLIRLTAAEWARLVEILTILIAVMTKYMPTIQVVGPVRSMPSNHFRSQVMLDYAPLHEVVHQLIFRSKQRFQVHVRTLRRAVDTLTADFRHVCRAGERDDNRPPEVWQSLDYEFHDFDLLTKEVLLALRSFLSGLPESTVSEFAAELTASLPRGVRSKTWDLSGDPHQPIQR